MIDLSEINARDFQTRDIRQRRRALRSALAILLGRERETRRPSIINASAQRGGKGKEGASTTTIRNCALVISTDCHNESNG